MLFSRKKNNKKTGDLGEDLACKELCRCGYTIIERNYRTKRGEIDIVAEENGDLVFIEVKTRKNSFFGRPEEAIDNAKASKISRCAQEYLFSHKRTDISVRCDVVSILLDNSDISNPLTIEIFKDAVDMGDFLI